MREIYGQAGKLLDLQESAACRWLVS